MYGGVSSSSKWPESMVNTELSEGQSEKKNSYFLWCYDFWKPSLYDVADPFTAFLISPGLNN